MEAQAAVSDIAVVAAALSDIGTVGILVAFIYAIWKDHQLQQERLYQITMKALDEAFRDEDEE